MTDINYSTQKKIRASLCILIALVTVAAGYLIGLAVNSRAEEQLITCWVLCRPGSQVNVRRTPTKSGEEVAQLEVGDSFQTDGSSANGFIRVYGIGEYGEGWIYCGYVSELEPVKIYERYVCVANKQVACRRWMNGPQTEHPWLKCGSTVEVFWMTDEWAVTSRGYIASEWLEVDTR